MEEKELPIFRTSETLANMKKDRFVVPQPTSLFVCENYVLNEESRIRTVNKLVDRTPAWLNYSQEEQIEEIKAALILQTVAEYLYAKNYIQSTCTMFENGFDKDGNIVLDAFYVKDTAVKKKWEREFKNKRIAKQNSKNKKVVPFKTKNQKGGM